VLTVRMEMGGPIDSNRRTGRGVCNLSNARLGESMEFTEEGLKAVKTLKFAQMVNDYLSPWREQGVSDLTLTKLLAAVVSWAATGQAICEPPSGRQSYELTAFALSHATDINDLSASVGENIFSLHTRH
jgi:hypothetical protein